MKQHIPVSQPLLGEEESRVVNDALDQGAISGLFGEYIPRFEKEFAQYSDCSIGVSVTNGTAAIHLALAAFSIGKGDEVLVSTLTNMATFFAVLYQGAVPVPIDIELDTLNLDPKLLEEKITSKTKAILVVHLFGHPVDMDPVLEVAKKHNLVVIEDCAEAHGATYNGKKVGGIGNVGAFSFYANKIITTGEGGMVTFSNREAAAKAKNLKELAFGDKNKFMHKDIGFNYRMTNLQAAIGCAQLEKIEKIIAFKRKMAAFYNSSFKDIESLQLPVEKPYARNVYWMYHILLQGKAAEKRTMVMQKLHEKGIETREGFIPYNLQDVFIKKGMVEPDDCPNANEVAYRGFYLPSGPALTEDQLGYVAQNVKSILKSV